jgi:hypothetical protein
MKPHISGLVTLVVETHAFSLVATVGVRSGNLKLTGADLTHVLILDGFRGERRQEIILQKLIAMRPLSLLMRRQQGEYRCLATVTHGDTLLPSF